MTTSSTLEQVVPLISGPPPGTKKFAWERIWRYCRLIDLLDGTARNTIFALASLLLNVNCSETLEIE